MEHAKKAMWVLIAMWLWAVAAAGETLPVTPQMLQEGNYQVTLKTPCNWDKNTELVTVMGHYVTETNTLDGGIAPISKQLVENDLHLVFDPSVDMLEGVPLHHMDVEVVTTGATCKADFGFDQSNFTKKRR